MFQNIEAVIFDLDGTLIDSMGIWHQIDIDYLASYDFSLPEDLHQNIEGMSFTETAQYFKERFQIPDDVEVIKDRWHDMAREHYAHHIQLKKGALQVLDYLDKKGMALGIGTSNYSELVDLVLENHQIKHRFQSIRTSCEVERGKPYPDIYLLVAKDLNVNPERCLVFEDIPNGILAAKRAEMKTCAVFDEASKHVQNQLMEMSDYYIQDYGQILNMKDEGHDYNVSANM